MILPVSDNFCDYVMFGIIFQRVLRELVGGCWLFREVGYSLLVSVVKELKTRKKNRSKDFPNSSLLLYSC